MGIQNGRQADQPALKQDGESIFIRTSGTVQPLKLSEWEILDNEIFHGRRLQVTQEQTHGGIRISNSSEDLGAIRILPKEYTEPYDRFTLHLRLTVHRNDGRIAIFYRTKSENSREDCGFFEIDGMNPSLINHSVINEGRKSHNKAEYFLPSDKESELVLDVNKPFGLTKAYLNGTYLNGTIDVPDVDSAIYLVISNAEVTVSGIRLTAGSYDAFRALEALTLASPVLSAGSCAEVKGTASAQIPLESVRLLVWNRPQKEYLAGSESLILHAASTDSEGRTLIFHYDGLSSMQLTDTVYCRACAVLPGREVYSDVIGITPAEFAFADSQTDAGQICEVKAENGTFSDGLKQKYVAAGTVLTVHADSVHGQTFSHFETRTGETIGTDSTLEWTAEENILIKAVYRPSEFRTLEIKAATYNTAAQMQAECGYEAIAGDIAACGAEIVSLQEVAKTIGTTDTMELLAEKTGYHQAFVHTANNCVIGAYGNGILSKYPILSTEIIPLPTRPRTSHRRYTLHAKLDVKGTVVDFFAIHCEQCSFEKEMKTVAMETAKCESFIIAGDYNDQNFEHFAVLPDSHILNNAETPLETTVDGYMFDNFILSDNISYRDVKVIKTGHSDHYLLTATLILKVRN